MVKKAARREQARKERMLQEFRAEVDADMKMPRGAFYLSPRNDMDMATRWPRAGGRKWRYFYRTFDDGTEHLVNFPNTAHGNVDRQTSVGPQNVFVSKGYKEVDGDELIAIVERQQAECRARMVTKIEIEDARNALPEVPATRGRRTRVQGNA